VFERYTERARQVVVLAQVEARTLKHDYIGTEHILLGLLREREGLAARVLESAGVTAEAARVAVVRTVGSGEEMSRGQIPFTPRAKEVLARALRESAGLGHNYIGTEHILLALVAGGEGVAVRVLLDFGADEQRIRAEVMRIVASPPGAAAVRESAPVGRPPRMSRHWLWRGGTDGEPKHAPLSGWRRQSVALAALGAESLSRRALSASAAGGLDPIALRVLLAVGLTQSSEDAESAGHARSRASIMALASCDDEELDAAVGALLTNALVESIRLTSGEPQEEDKWLSLTAAGAARIEAWLQRVAPMFAAWPPDRPDVDDAY